MWGGPNGHQHQEKFHVSMLTMLLTYFLNILTIILLASSTWPEDWGWYAMRNITSISNISHKFPLHQLWNEYLCPSQWTEVSPNSWTTWFNSKRAVVLVSWCHKVLVNTQSTWWTWRWRGICYLARTLVQDHSSPLGGWTKERWSLYPVVRLSSMAEMDGSGSRLNIPWNNCLCPWSWKASKLPAVGSCTWPQRSYRLHMGDNEHASSWPPYGQSEQLNGVVLGHGEHTLPVLSQSSGNTVGSEVKFTVQVCLSRSHSSWNYPQLLLFTRRLASSLAVLSGPGI